MSHSALFGSPADASGQYLIRLSLSYLPAAQDWEVSVRASSASMAIEELARRTSAAHAGAVALDNVAPSGYGRAVANLRRIDGGVFPNGQSWATLSLEVIRWPVMSLESSACGSVLRAQHYFHLTPASFLPGILDKGLLPRRGLRAMRARETVEQVFLHADLGGVVQAIERWVPQMFAEREAVSLVVIEGLQARIHVRSDQAGYVASCGDAIPAHYLGVLIRDVRSLVSPARDISDALAERACVA